MSDATGGGDDGTLPQWAMSFFEEYGSPDLGELGDVFHGPLLDRKYGLRKDDLVEILLDSRMLPEGRDPMHKGDDGRGEKFFYRYPGRRQRFQVYITRCHRGGKASYASQEVIHRG